MENAKIVRTRKHINELKTVTYDSFVFLLKIINTKYERRYI